MRETEFKALQMKESLEKLYEDLKTLLQTSEYKDMLQQFVEDYERIAHNDKITIVIYGGYSTGKSTIVSALTGDDSIPIGTDVTTEKANDYDYSGVRIVDTPGIFSDNEMHAQRAERELRCADQVLFCISADLLFSETSKKEYLHVLDVCGQKKVVLCINKLDKIWDHDEDLIDLYSSKSEDIAQAFQDVDDFALENNNYCFISAKDYIDGMKTTDQYLIGDSNFAGLLDFLNGVDKEGSFSLMDKCRKQMICISGFMEQINCRIGETETESDKTKREKLYRQEKEKILESQRKIRREMTDQIRAYKGAMREDFVKRIYDGSLKQEDVDEEWLETKRDLKEYFINLISDYNFTEGEMYKETDDGGIEISEKKRKKKTDPNQSAAQKTAGVIHNLAEQIGKMAEPVVVKKRKFHPDQMSEIGGKGTVLAQKFSKFSEKHGEKMAMGLGKSAKFVQENASIINAATTVLDIGIDIGYSVKEKLDEKKIELAQRDVRQKVGGAFDRLNNQYNSRIQELADRLIQSLDRKFHVVREDSFGTKYRTLDMECQKLKNEIDANICKGNG